MLDALTYAGSIENLAPLLADPAHAFEHGSITDGELVTRVLEQYRPSAIVNFAAESHVDRSIDRPSVFVETNVAGVLTLLEAARVYLTALPAQQRDAFRFVQVSTDEVYGSVDAGESSEEDPFRPNSPYSASKAGGDHLARAYFATYGLPVLVTHGSNTFGPRQYPEKLIPVMLLHAIAGEPLPVYGDGGNVRDWLYVDDHAAAIAAILESGTPGEAYNIGAEAGLKNIEVVDMLCDELDRIRPRADGGSYRQQIAFVEDRPGHDRRYSVSCEKISKHLGWRAGTRFVDGIAETVSWYLDQEVWWQEIRKRDGGLKRIGLRRG